ncbi:hypothetical protein U9M48_026648 [Paspalum notatum var. saurae]|uniref:BTB domain-containing protein n=1 Tax=Paspalum notatum var. saurae TaxID=547442 RepID=A0AAQ3TSR7_PASNO
MVSRFKSLVPASFSCYLLDPVTLERVPHKEKTASSDFAQTTHVDIPLMLRSYLEGSQYLKDDYFIVQCAITVLLAEKPSDPAAAADVSPSVPSSDMHQQLGELLRRRTRVGADVTFLVAGESIRAHRSVLAARSPVFMAELFGANMREKASPCVEVQEMEAEVFRAMLRFVYTDTVPELEELEGEQATSMAQHLLEAADRYGLMRLKRICVHKVCADIGVDTVATTLALAEQHGCSNLKATCMRFILANFSAVSETEGYSHLEASCPSVLTQLLRLTVEGHM